MKIAVINESPSVYNLAAARIRQKLLNEGHEIFPSIRADMWSAQCQKAYLSAIFTWHLPDLCYDAKMLQQAGVEVEIGGPAATAMPEYVRDNTGVWPHVGLDERFEHVPGRYQATFTSRGCPRACEFCLVSKLEGTKMIEYDEFPIPEGKNPYVCDNNMLLTSWEHQQLVVKKLKQVRNLDINSGFDDRIFTRDPERYWKLYSQLKLEAWRFAYDSPEQREPIFECSKFLHARGVDYRRIIVFCLVGFPGSTFEEAREKLQYLIDIETSPYPMVYRPLDTVDKKTTPPGWEKDDLKLLFNYFGVPFKWRACTWKQYLEREAPDDVIRRLKGGR